LPISSAGQYINLHVATWNAVVEYNTMLDNPLPALQNILTCNCGAMEKRFADVEDELGLVVTDM
jgi:hypothetical protein